MPGDPVTAHLPLGIAVLYNAELSGTDHRVPDTLTAPKHAMDLAKLSRHELDNGLRITLLPDDSLSLVAVNLWYHVGSKNERPGLTGFAHLFEHMLFQGSQNVSSNGHFEHVQRVGGVANGSTWYDRTNYYETLPSSAFETGLWLESDRMGFLLPAMTSEKLENQRSVVMNERRQRVDNQPYGQASERLSELLYPAEHPYHWPVIGYMEDIEAATLEDVTQFFETFYTPNNADSDPGRRLRAEARTRARSPPTSARSRADPKSSRCGRACRRPGCSARSSKTRCSCRASTSPTRSTASAARRVVRRQPALPDDESGALEPAAPLSGL